MRNALVGACACQARCHLMCLASSSLRANFLGQLDHVQGKGRSPAGGGYEGRLGEIYLFTDLSLGKGFNI